MNLNFSRSNCDVFIPDGVTPGVALARTTHLGIGAHQDDLEFMAFHGIIACYQHEEGRWFSGVTCTDGAGSARQGRYATFTDEQMKEIRVVEQRAAATVGHYAAMIQLGHPSSTVKAPGAPELVDDLRQILTLASPDVIYTHNPADKHDTHLAVLGGVLRALRSMPAEARPRQLLGCEVWRGLDWLGDREKVALDVTGYDNLAAALNGIFDSQIAGGKRYDLATLGRRAANATFFESHATDTASQLCFAIDLTPLINDSTLTPTDYVLAAIDRFRDDVRLRTLKYLA